jgi:hypothetical protein
MTGDKRTASPYDGDQDRELSRADSIVNGDGEGLQVWSLTEKKDWFGLCGLPSGFLIFYEINS